MFSEQIKKDILNNIIKDMKRYSIKPSEYPIYLDSRINYEITKIKKNNDNFEQIAVYDEISDITNVNDFNIVLEDFIGKDERLNVYNSTQDPKYDKYYTNNIESKTVDCLFKKNKYSLIFDIYTFVTNFIVFSKKHYIVSTVAIINSILSILFKFCSLIIFGIVDLFVFGLFKLLKLCIKSRYKIKRKNKILFFIANPFIGSVIIILKFIINTINNCCYLFNSIFNSNIEIVFNFVADAINDSLYSNNLLNAKVNRDYRSNEHKELIEKINNKSLAFLKECLQNSKIYLQQFNFSKVSIKAANPELINNPTIKANLIELEKQQTKELKQSIIKHQFGIILKNIDRSKKIILNVDKKINKIMLECVNKNAKLFKEFYKTNYREKDGI